MFFYFADVDGKDSRYTFFFHRNAVKSVCRFHRSATVRDNDELRLVVTVQVFRIPHNVNVVKRRFYLVKQAERCGSYRQYRKIQRYRRKRLFAARKRGQMLYYLARRCDVYIYARFSFVLEGR